MDFWIFSESEITRVERKKGGMMILKASYSFNLDGLWC